MSKIEIEINGLNNENLSFRPLQRTLRGRFDLNRVAEPMARVKIRDFPEPIPGVILGIDTKSGTGYIREPLYDEAFSSIREKIESAGMNLDKQEEQFEKIDAPTWTYWMKRAVQGGHASILTGEFPSKIEGEIKRDFVTNRQPDKRDDLIEKLIGIVYSTLPPEKKKELTALMEA